MSIEFIQKDGEWCSGDYKVVLENCCGVDRYTVLYNGHVIANNIKTLDCALSSAHSYENTLKDIEDEAV